MHGKRTVRALPAHRMDARRGGDGGFTLIEICVAIAIVALGILTAMSILVPALRWAGDARREMTVGQAVIDFMSLANSAGVDPTTSPAPPDPAAHFYIQAGGIDIRTGLGCFAVDGQLLTGIQSPTLLGKQRKFDPQNGVYSGTVDAPIFSIQVKLFRE